ncbi:MAG TPA: cupin domain-containing protein [Candidatus Thermoplasmatota archaeon]|nr:cupin domain-containing protein [Candidatus Thermoplasmatota archaeon]
MVDTSARIVRPAEGGFETPLSKGSFVEAGPERPLDVPAGAAAVLLDGLLGATPPFGFLLAGATPVTESPTVPSKLFVYEPAIGEGDPGLRRLSLLPTTALEGNAFVPLAETRRLAAALLRVAPGRGVTAGHESERAFLVLRGSGVAFMEDGNNLAYQPGEIVLVPAGDAVRLWARDPDPLIAVVFQPQAAPAPKRTLAGEVQRLLGERGRVE